MIIFNFKIIKKCLIKFKYDKLRNLEFYLKRI
jgi:hypothetical protein